MNKNKKIKGWIRFSYYLKKNELQKKIILDYCKKNHLTLDKEEPWIENEFISDLKLDFEKSEKNLAELEKDDLLIVSELTSLSRSKTNLPRIIRHLWERGVDLYSIKEDLRFSFNNPQLVQPARMFCLVDELREALEIRRGLDKYEKARYKKNYASKNLDVVRNEYLKEKQQGIITSKFDPYRERIIELLKQGYGYYRIRDDIKIGSSEGIKDYIKRKNLREEV